jgi:hypothetical protein
MLEGVHTLAADDTNIAPNREFAATLKRVKQLPPIIEGEINTVVMACTLARRGLERRRRS